LAPSLLHRLDSRIVRIDRPHRLGLLAGGGRFPILVAQAAREQGHQVVAVGVKGEATGELEDVCQECYWAGVAKLGRMIRLFRCAQVDCVVMAGKIHKTAMFSPWRWLRYVPDLRALRVWYRYATEDKRDDTLLLATVREFEKEGLMIESALRYCPDLLAKKGCLTARRPTGSEQDDIALGWQLAKEMGRLDVGQSVAVNQGAVLAVEAIEGTDRMILRAGYLCCNKGFTVVKVAKPQQDPRFDVPTIGADTIETLRMAGGKVLAIEAGATIVIDQPKVIELAERYRISVVALDEQGDWAQCDAVGAAASAREFAA
jgi:DUF1009 family protein